MRPGSKPYFRFRLHVFLFCVFVSLPIVFGLECFSCLNQEDNHDKCVSTVQLCDPEIHDTCSTNVRWGVTFYWLPAVKRIHYISKACDNRRNCEQRRHQLESRCYRDWWADWQCEDCCNGDRCNYYVVLASSRLSGNKHLVLMATSSLLFCIIRVGQVAL